MKYKFWFKNIMAYRLNSALAFSFDEFEQQLITMKFTPCQSYDMTKFGWSPPLEVNDRLYFSQGKQILLVCHKEDKSLPTQVIKQECHQRITKLEDKLQRKLTKIEKQSIKDEVIVALLPRAFSKHQFTALWIDLENQIIFLDTASSKRAEESLSLLRKTLGSLPVTPLAFNHSPSDIMTQWLTHHHLPDWLLLSDEAELKSFNTESVIRCKNQDLTSDEIQIHLQAGKYVSKLAVDWENYFSCVINQEGNLQRIKFADAIREKNEDIAKEDYPQRFDADFFIMTETLRLFMQKFIPLLGGLIDRN